MNIVLNLILVRFLAHGGLALATSIAAIASCLLLAYHLRRRLGHLDGRRILNSAGKFAAASLAMGLAVTAAGGYAAAFFDPALLTHQLLQVGGLIALGGAVYFGAAALLKTEELARAIAWASARLPAAFFKRFIQGWDMLKYKIRKK